MAVLEQKPGKFRIIINHSYPQSDFSSAAAVRASLPDSLIIDPSKISINSLINSDDFPCDWGTFADCYLQVAVAPEGTQVAVFDVDAAFRNVPLHRSTRRFVALFLDGLIFLDLCLNFGKQSAPGIWGRIADVMVKILLERGIEALLKWVDDFIFFRFPKSRNSDGSFTYSYDESLIWSVAAELGWPWAPKKFVPFAFSFLYIGFLWDLTNKTVQLPIDKKIKYANRVLPGTDTDAFMTLNKAEELIGTLNHVCLVLPTGRTRLVSLYKFRAGFKHSRSTMAAHRIGLSLKDDLNWWVDTLQSDFVGMSIFTLPDYIEISLFVDASTSWGIGLTLNGRWLAWQFKKGWRSPEREIGWAEMVAVELAVRTLVSTGIRDARVVVRSDNEGVVGALRKGCSRGSEQNLILRNIIELMQAHHIWVECNWVSTHENPADGPSRGVFPPRRLLHPHPPSIPRHLTPYVHNSVTPSDARLKSLQ
ncbi:hypothetical protein HHX47_DHR3000091 [Lentinula edodes]|nr:hypothetical protein HHX47_DHR3000091 [Lentinula edodes]